MKRLLAFLLSLFLSTGTALAQTGETINQLSPGAALAGTEQIPMYQAANPAVTTTPSAVATYAVGAQRNNLNDWVNIKDPRFGATGNGSTDDTAAIQSAIDYAFANNLTAVYCPAGMYKTTSTIYLDPPGNLRSNFSSPTKFQFTMAFFGDPKGSGALPLPSSPPCQIQPTFNNAVAFIVGPGQGMRVSDIAVVGPNNAYRGNMPSNGVGIGVAGGNGGASNTLIRDTFVRYFYSLYMTDANNGCCLADSNAFDHVGGYDGYYGIRLYGTQSFINDITEPVFGDVTVAIDDEEGHQTQITGGNLSAPSASNAFGIASVAAGNCGGYTLCLTATVASPDGNIANVYDSYEILTLHFGLIPFYLTGWNSSTNVISLQATNAWLYTNYGTHSYWYNNDIYSELNAATILYASERLRVVKGVGFSLDGTHIENSNACTTAFDINQVWNGQASTEIKNPFFDYKTSLPQDASQANQYCQQVWSFVDNGQSADHSLRLSGGNWSSSAGSTDYPLNVDSVPSGRIFGSQLNGAGLFNFRFSGAAYSQIDTTNYQLATVARGIGVWDNDYFLPGQSGYPSNSAVAQWQLGELASQFCGYEPCPSTIPNLSPTLFALVCPSAVAGSPDTFARVAYTCSSLGSLGSYPPIAARTVFKSVDWNTGSPNKLFLHSGQGSTIPGWSWGQNIMINTAGGSSINPGSINGTIAGTTLTVNWINSGSVNVGDYVVGLGVPLGTIIESGTGPYTLNNSASVIGENLSVNLPQNAIVTGSISGTTLCVTAVTRGSLNAGDLITGSGVTAGTVVVGPGGSGCAGTAYQISASQTVASETITAPSITWEYKRGSSDLYLDAATMAWMFPGLGISINNGESTQPYTVTGIYPYLGYVTVIWAGNSSGVNTGVSPDSVGLQGAANQVYSCSSSCAIGQAPFAWAAY